MIVQNLNVFEKIFQNIQTFYHFLTLPEAPNIRDIDIRENCSNVNIRRSTHQNNRSPAEFELPSKKSKYKVRKSSLSKIFQKKMRVLKSFADFTVYIWL